MAGGIVREESEESEHAEQRALADAVAADAHGQHGGGIRDGHRERDFNEGERKTDAAGKQPHGEEIEEPDGVAHDEGGEKNRGSRARADENVGERGGPLFAETASEPGRRTAAEKNTGHDARH